MLNPTTPLDVAIARTAGRAAERPAPRASADTGASHHASTSARGSDPLGSTQRALGAYLSSRAKGGGDSSQGEGGILGGLIRAVRRSSSTGGRAGASSGGSGGGSAASSPADAAAERLRGMALAAEQQQAARSEGVGDAGGAPPPDQLVCPITNDLFKDPVEAADGRVYERDAIEVGVLEPFLNHFSGPVSPTCPTTWAKKTTIAHPGSTSSSEPLLRWNQPETFPYHHAVRVKPSSMPPFLYQPQPTCPPPST